MSASGVLVGRWSQRTLFVRLVLVAACGLVRGKASLGTPGLGGKENEKI